MESCEYGGERDCKKMSAKVNARYFFGNFLSLGTVTGLSENCMCINTDMCIPLGSRIELLIPSGKDILSVPVSVRRFNNKDSIFDTMCVEVLNPSSGYTEFVNSL